MASLMSTDLLASVYGLRAGTEAGSKLAFVFCGKRGVALLGAEGTLGLVGIIERPLAPVYQVGSRDLNNKMRKLWSASNGGRIAVFAEPGGLVLKAKALPPLCLSASETSRDDVAAIGVISSYLAQDTFGYDAVSLFRCEECRNLFGALFLSAYSSGQQLHCWCSHKTVGFQCENFTASIGKEPDCIWHLPGRLLAAYFRFCREPTFGRPKLVRTKGGHWLLYCRLNRDRKVGRLWAVCVLKKEEQLLTPNSTDTALAIEYSNYDLARLLLYAVGNDDFRLTKEAGTLMLRWEKETIYGAITAGTYEPFVNKQLEVLWPRGMAEATRSLLRAAPFPGRIRCGFNRMGNFVAFRHIPKRGMLTLEVGVNLGDCELAK